jgi:hypothetical protein
MTFTIEIAGVDVSEYITRKPLEIPIQDNNRNVEPIASGFTINVSNAYTGTISPGDKVEFFIDSVAKFRGFVNTSENVLRNKFRVVTVYHVLRLLQNKKIDHETLGLLLSDTAPFSGSEKTVVSVSTVANTIEITSHGYSNGDAIQFKSTSTLPSPFIDGEQYYVLNKTTDEFQVGNDQLVPINILSTGSGTITVDLADTSKYMRDDTDGYPNVSLAWVIENIIGLAGMSINSTAIDSTTIYTTTSPSITYNWKELVFDENMFYAINQPVAANYTIDFINVEFTNSYLANKLNCFTFLAFIIGKLGFRLSYTGSETITITKWTNTVYSISSGDRLEYREYTDSQTGRVAFGSESYNDDRDVYSANTTPGDTATIENGSNFNLAVPNTDRVEWFTNLKIFLREGTNSIRTSASTPFNYWEIEQASTNSINAIQEDWDVEEITAPIQASNVNVLKEVIKVDNSKKQAIQQSEIIQETKV